MDKTVHRPGSATIYDRSHRAAGFTLLEISIVLVVIGLLVGAIIVGRDMIHDAELRGFVRQIDRYNMAIRMFKIKFGCLPGDCTKLTSSFPSADITNGDGNGLINDVDATYGGGRSFYYETGSAWEVLSQSSLLDGNYTVLGGALGTGWPTVYANGSSGIMLAAINGQQYYRTGINARGGAGAVGPYGGAANMTDWSPYGVHTFAPLDAFNIVSKIADGVPNNIIKILNLCVYNCFDWTVTTDSGNFGTIISPGPMGPAQPYCYSGVTSAFNVQYTKPICDLAIPTNF